MVKTCSLKPMMLTGFIFGSQSRGNQDTVASVFLMGRIALLSVP